MSEGQTGEELQERGLQLFRQGLFGDAAATLQRAFRAFVDQDNPTAALRVAIRLTTLNDTLGQESDSRGWERRAERLLEQTGRCVEQGYLALCLAGCEIHDPLELAGRADVALDIARQFGDHDLELRALADRGLSHVRMGEVETGFGLLDEVMVAVAAGEITRPEVRGLTICAMLSACQWTGDAGRAAYWRERVLGDPYLNEIAIAGTHCLLAQGAVDALLGQWQAAEDRLQAALNASMTSSYHRTNTLAYLADPRILQGRYVEAAQLLRGLEDKFEALPVLARLRLAQGKPEEAVTELRLVARGLGSDRIRLAPVLCDLVEAELRSGHAAEADEAAKRLAELAEAVDSGEIRAASRLAAGRIALNKGDHELAVEELETGLALVLRTDRPVLCGQLRLELARVRLQTGALAAAAADAEAALATFGRVGAATYAGKCQALLKELRGVRPAKPCNPAGLSERELEVARLIAAGKNNQEIADALVLSVRTVERHVSTIYEKLGSSGRTARAATTAYVLSNQLA